ncbi:hypothetical protein BYT27DRAFT_7104261, partial [Phlegmacium glaucopus]
RCLAHVINLATQALISTYSKTKHFDPKEPNDHEPDIDAFQRDEVGLIHSITVKARSSAKRKERLLKIQKRSGRNVLMLLLDMKEPDLHKRAKIDALKLTEEEWKRLKLFINLLEVRLLVFVPKNINCCVYLECRSRTTGFFI